MQRKTTIVNKIHIILSHKHTQKQTHTQNNILSQQEISCLSTAVFLLSLLQVSDMASIAFTVPADEREI